MSDAFQPRNERELSETLRGCSAQSRRVRLSGGGLVAKDPSEKSLGVWLFGITGVVEIREDDLVATARAGISIADLDSELRSRGRRFPLRPHDVGERATVGGVFAAGADGLRARLGFRARDMLLGARAVLPSGEVVFVGAKVVKSVAGYDVCKSLVGSRGCLAALSELTFRVEAVPEAGATLVGAFARRVEAHAAVAAIDSQAMQASGLVVSKQGDGFRVDALFEGPRAAVIETSRRMLKLGFQHEAGDWDRLTSLAAVDPKPPLVRASLRASRAAPLDCVPPAADAFVVDVLRGRCVAHVPAPELTLATEPARAGDALLERVRLAFDPASIFEPGRGLAVS
jgi:FAD/FMN-containing dehydrogenase